MRPRARTCGGHRRRSVPSDACWPSSSYASPAWVRVYAYDYSPSAMEGFYIVHLFATDGSAVYLSPQPGHLGIPIECDAAGQRPRGVACPAAEARRSLDDLERIPL